MSDRNPQASQMADESMVRTLAAQVRCIWPQEKAFFERYGEPKLILDVGCGTGEFTARLAERYPQATILGVELNAEHIARAQQRCRVFGARVQIEQGNAFNLEVPANRFDLVVCRHLLQSIPQPELVVAQCKRVLKPDGWIHLLLEDYTMIHMEGLSSLDRFWLDGPVRFGEDTTCDLRIGRRGIALLAGFADRKINFVAVDTERVSRADFADVFIAWRDGYSALLVPYLGRTVAEVEDIWNQMIDVIKTGYALWQVPIVSGRKIK